MKYLGLDIASNKTGYALLDEDEVVDYGVIITEGTGISKLMDFYSKLVGILQQYEDVDYVGIEDTYIKNVKLTKLLMKYHGVAQLVVGMLFKIGLLLDNASHDELVKRVKSTRSKAEMPRKCVFAMMPTEIFKHADALNMLERADKKIEAVQWANANFYLNLSDDQDDIADAIMIAFAVKQKILEYKK